MAKKVNGIRAADSRTPDSCNEWSTFAPAPVNVERDVTAEATQSVGGKPRSSNQN